MAQTKEEKSLVTNHIRSEATVVVLKALREFKSKADPNYKLSQKDIVNVLSNIIANKTS